MRVTFRVPLFGSPFGGRRFLKEACGIPLMRGASSAWAMLAMFPVKREPLTLTCFTIPQQGIKQGGSENHRNDSYNGYNGYMVLSVSLSGDGYSTVPTSLLSYSTATRFFRIPPFRGRREPNAPRPHIKKQIHINNIGTCIYTYTMD